MFGKKNLASINKRSESIFNVFTQTQKDCENLNKEIATIVEEKENEIKALQEEVTSLNAISTKHTNLSNKISTFLNS